MADTPRSEATLLTLFADNTSGDVTPQDMRDSIVSNWNSIDDGAIDTSAKSNGYVLTWSTSGNEWVAQVNDHDALVNFVANEHIDHTAVTITAGDGLAGGGTIAATRTLDVDIASETTVTAAAGDLILIADVDDSNNIKKVTAQTIADISTSGIENVVEDTTPQLGGQLDVNGNSLGDGTLELLSFSETGSAINELTITNAAVAGSPLTDCYGR